MSEREREGERSEQHDAIKEAACVLHEYLNEEIVRLVSFEVYPMKFFLCREFRKKNNNTSPNDHSNIKV